MTTPNHLPTAPVMPWTGGPWTRAAVYGLGLSGRAAARWLLARQVDVVAFDQRSTEQLAADPEFAELLREPGLRLESGSEPQDLPVDLAWTEVDALVLSPGVPADRPLVAAAGRAGVPVLAEVELAFPFLRGTVVAITGSNGKSTTTALAAALLRSAGMEAHACGNFGEPLITFADPPAGESVEPTFIVELSSFQLETVDRFRPRAAALLNVAADHLDRYASLEDYGRAKLRIFGRQQAGDIAVLNADDPRVRAAAAELRARCRFFSRRGPVADGCWLHDGQILETAPGLAAPRVLFAASDVPLPGVHQLENAMAAALLALAAGAPAEDLADGLRRFRGLPHRLEPVATVGGVSYFDDSKGTNPAAVVKSLEGFADDSVHLILGGRFKGGDLDELMAMAVRKVHRAYLIGESAARFAAALGAVGVAHETTVTLETTVARASAEALPGQSVVLSPACSSFDQFTNFAQRGKVFQQLVRRCVAQPTGEQEAGHGA